MLLLIFACTLASAYFAPDGRGRGNDFVLIKFVATVAEVVLAVVWLRLLALSDDAGSGTSAHGSLGRATLSYVLRSLLILIPGVALAGAVAGVWALAFGWPRPEPGMTPSLGFIATSLVVAALAWWTILRLQLYPIASAVGDNKLGLVAAWRLTAGHTHRLMAAMLLLMLLQLAVGILVSLPPLLLQLLAMAMAEGAGPTHLGLFAAAAQKIAAQTVASALPARWQQA